MIDLCFKCHSVPILCPANKTNTEWVCVCDCGEQAHSARNKKGAVDNWNTLQRLLEWHVRNGMQESI